MIDIALSPVLREQLEYLQAQRGRLESDVTSLYKEFLALVDEKSEQESSQEQGESLQKIYDMVAQRVDTISKKMDEDAEDMDALLAEIEAIEKEDDQEAWQELTDELFADGEYKTDFASFKNDVDLEISQLRSEISAIIDDWKNLLAEGNIRELSLLIEVFEDEKAQEECCGGSSCATSDNDEESDDEEGCCGRMDPCCKTQ